METVYNTRTFVCWGGVWEDAKRIFHKYPELKYLPVYNQDNELAYFCYDSRINEVSNLQVEHVLKMLLSNPQLLKWKQEFPGIECVEIYDMNEFAFYFFEILSRKGIEVIMHGEKWKIFGIEIDKHQTHMDVTVLKIYAEGMEMFPQKTVEYDVAQSFNFLLILMKKELRLLEMRLQEKIDNFFICRFPLLEELSYITNKEKYMTYFVGGADGRELIESSQRTAFTEVNGLEPDVYYKEKEWEEHNVIDTLSEYYGETKVIRTSHGENTIWLLGPCIVAGFGVLYHDFLSCNIDRYIKFLGINNYGVCNVNYSFYEIDTLQMAISSLPIQKKDIIICIGEDIGWGTLLREKPDLKLDLLFATRDEEQWFYNVPIHTNARGNEQVAKEICKQIISPFISRSQGMEDGFIITNDMGFAVNERGQKEIEIKKYIQRLKTEYNIQSFLGDSKRIGAIVMNCNPFTLGHRYLIEESSKKVDKLIVFVVEENRSYFGFKDRFSMVKAGTQDIENILVVPSGDFVLSYHTLPEYFRKEEKNQVKIDASMDVNIFCKYIVPEFGINIRFVGEEPIDQITAQYNQQMQKIFSAMSNMEFSEIPRKEYEGEVISASSVRKELKRGNWEKIKRMVPETTYEYLRKKC